MRLTLLVLGKVSVLLVLVLSGSLMVTPGAQGQATVSVQAGAIFATWGGSDAEEGVDFGYRTGLAFRVSAVLPLSDLVGLQVGAAYVQKGTFAEEQDLDFPDSEIDFEVTADMRYLDLPVLLRVSPKLEGPMSPYVTAGPAVSFSHKCNISSSFTFTFTDYDTGEVITTSESETERCNDEEDAFKTFDFGVTAGAGVAFAVSPSLSLTLDVLYNHSLVSFDKEEGDIKNRAFAIMAGVAFPIR